MSDDVFIPPHLVRPVAEFLAIGIERCDRDGEPVSPLMRSLASVMLRTPEGEMWVSVKRGAKVWDWLPEDGRWLLRIARKAARVRVVEIATRDGVVVYRYGYAPHYRWSEVAVDDCALASKPKKS